MKERDLSLDIIRIVACCFVVLMHSPIPSANANGVFLTGLSYFTSPCIGLFFMVSGALLLPVKTDYFMFLRRRLSKIVVPTMVWTTIYIVLNVYCSNSEINILQTVMSVPFSAQGHGVLWFMYTLIGLYLLAPILSAWLDRASDKELKFVLLLWGVSLCYPLLSMCLSINTGTTGILYYFTGYAGYFVLGYALKHNRIKISLVLSVLVAFLGIILLLVLKKYSIEYDFYSLFGYESIFIAAFCVAIWRTINKIYNRFIKNRISHKCSGLLNGLSNISFGIYLIHILIMRNLLWPWGGKVSSYVAQTTIIAILTLLISSTVCVLISRTPLGNIVIGYRSK